MVCSIVLENSLTGIQTCLILESDQRWKKFIEITFALLPNNRTLSSGKKTAGTTACMVP